MKKGVMKNPIKGGGGLKKVMLGFVIDSCYC